jgi:tetratricopeptide (TPR) repeat protein
MNKTILSKTRLKSTAGLSCIVAVLSAVPVAALAAHDAQNVSALMKRGEKLELDIAKRQREALKAGDAVAAQYKQGFHDGYNKAVLDLVKSKLLAADPKATKNLATLNAGTAPDANKSDIVFWIEKSVASLHGHHWDMAIEASNEAIKTDSSHISPYINRSWGYAEKGYIQRAIADANQAILINPENPLAYNNRGYAHELGGLIVDAKADYQQACNLNYQPACNYSLKIASVAAADIAKQVATLVSKSYEKFEHKNWQQVVGLSTRVLNLDPDNAVAYANRAGARTELGQLPDALDDARHAIKLNPKFGVAHNNQGYVYELMGKREEAASSYQKACNLGVKQSCADYRRMAASFASN